MDNYVQIMLDSLKKKEEILDKIVDRNKEQAQVLKDVPFSLEEFDKTVDEKAVLIEQLTKLDNGFETMYERVKEELGTEAGKKKYQNEIKQMQEFITAITEKSVSIQAQESRNKQMVESAFRKEREKIKSGKQGSAVARNYYKTMNQTNFVSPHFLDQKN